MVNKIEFTKPPTTTEEQIQILLKRGLIIADENKARGIIQEIGYSKLGGYLYLLETPPTTTKRSHKFRGASIEDAIELYRLNQKVSDVLLRATLDIEVFMRARICDKMSVLYKDPFWHYHFRYFSEESFKIKEDGSSHYGQFIAKLNATILQNSKVPFIEHHQKKYTFSDKIPFWHVKEIISFGTLVKLYKSLSQKNRMEIFDTFGVSESYFSSCLHYLDYIRNVCAHNARVIGVKFIQSIAYSRSLHEALDDDFSKSDARFTRTTVPSNLRTAIFVIHHFMKFMDRDTTFIDTMENLLTGFGKNSDYIFLQFEPQWFDKVRSFNPQKKPKKQPKV